MTFRATVYKVALGLIGTEHEIACMNQAHFRVADAMNTAIIWQREQRAMFQARAWILDIHEAKL